MVRESDDIEGRPRHAGDRGTLGWKEGPSGACVSTSDLRVYNEILADYPAGAVSATAVEVHVL